jgi:hypothetical protein
MSEYQRGGEQQIDNQGGSGETPRATPRGVPGNQITFVLHRKFSTVCPLAVLFMTKCAMGVKHKRKGLRSEDGSPSVVCFTYGPLPDFGSLLPSASDGFTGEAG